MEMNSLFSKCAIQVYNECVIQVYNECVVLCSVHAALSTNFSIED